jgi:hypothetical protein
MFTLGNKEAICNSNSKFTVTVPGTDMVNVKGFGTFEQTHIREWYAQRYVPSRVGELIITAPDAGDLGIVLGQVNVPVVVHIRVNTTRHSSEWAIDFIKRGRPFIFELMVNGGEDSVIIAGKLAAAFDEYEKKFVYADKGLPFEWADDGSGNITLTLKDPYLSFQKYVDFLPKGLTYGVKADTTTFIDSGENGTVAGNDVTVATAIPG